MIYSIKNLSAWYTENKNVLKQLNIEINSNEIVGIVGLNGAGKTTFINVVSGLHKHYIMSDENYIDFKNNKNKQIRYTVFAEDTSFGYFTFWEYINFVFESYNKIVDNNEIEEFIDGFNFKFYENYLIKDLSTGNKKKVYLITGLALKLPLLLLDEPVNGLDFESTEYLYKRILEYKQYGSIIFSSHILESICLTSDKVYIMKEGNFVKELVGEDINKEAIRGYVNEKTNKSKL